MDWVSSLWIRWMGLLLSVSLFVGCGCSDKSAVTKEEKKPTKREETQGVTLPCVLHFAKGTCWKNYEVTITYQDAVRLKKFASYVLPVGTLSKKVTTECVAGSRISFRAQFSPEIWAGDAKKSFRSVQVWPVPKQLSTGVKAWEVKVCFPHNFSNVPLPLTEFSNCSCVYE